MCYARRQRLSWARIKLSKKYLKPVSHTGLGSSLEAWAVCSFYLDFLSIISDASETLLQRFTVAEFSSIICFVFIFRCSIFKVQVLPTVIPSRRDSSTIISQFFRFVKGFCKISQNIFFEVLLFALALCDSFDIISQVFEFVKYFFSFSWFFLSACDILSVPSVSRGNGHYYSTLVSICQ